MCTLGGQNVSLCGAAATADISQSDFLLRRAVLCWRACSETSHLDAGDREPCLGMLFLPHFAGLGVEV